MSIIVCIGPELARPDYVAIGVKLPHKCIESPETGRDQIATAGYIDAGGIRRDALNLLEGSRRRQARPKFVAIEIIFAHESISKLGPGHIDAGCIDSCRESLVLAWSAELARPELCPIHIVLAHKDV